MAKAAGARLRLPQYFTGRVCFKQGRYDTSRADEYARHAEQESGGCGGARRGSSSEVRNILSKVQVLLARASYSRLV